VIDAETEVRISKRGTPESKNARARLRLKLTERLDALMAELERRPAAATKATVLESRFASLPLSTLVHAAQTHMSYIESVGYESAAKHEVLLDKLYGPDWLDAFRDLLEHHAPGWLSDFDARVTARLDAAGELR
jgi:hypothetical protein